jgi:hypothetical protein
LTDLALAPLAGYVASKIMEPVGAELYELESEQDHKREDQARAGAPYAIAARKTADLVGLHLFDKQHERLALAFHYGLAIQWAPLYPLLRRRTSLVLSPLGPPPGRDVAGRRRDMTLGFSAPNLGWAG